MNKTILWQDYLIEDTIPDLDLSKIIDHSYYLKKTDLGIQISNQRHSWHSSQLDPSSVECDETQKLIDYLNSLYDDLELDMYWFNVNSKGGMNSPHLHVDNKAVVSGVVYLQASPDQGNIVFVKDMELAKLRPKKYSVSMPSTTGTLYLFGCDTYHYVNVNKTDTDRISMSFNYKSK